MFLELMQAIARARSKTFYKKAVESQRKLYMGNPNLPKDLCRGSSIENGLPLRHSPAKKKLKVSEVDYHKVKHETLSNTTRQEKEGQGCGCRLDK